MHLISIAHSLTLFATAAYANTEKVIFSAPPAISIPDTGPSLETLQLVSLSAKSSKERLSLAVNFPSEEQPRGLESWYLLRDLSPTQRYEVRVCWAAIQPTTFWLDTYTVDHVFDTPPLVQSLAAFSLVRQEPNSQLLTGGHTGSDQESLLFLRLQAAADFFSSNTTLMQDPPPVDIDLILDPYLGNIFPRSLLPTGIYIVLLAIGGWWVSGVIWKQYFTPEKERKD
ncbi:hypothetical protein LTR86_000414 [Recurvomyces mirabilis]|nr:hypothetical protein LTR86_000414 [Recurvomyces mirabilis]